MYVCIYVYIFIYSLLKNKKMGNCFAIDVLYRFQYRNMIRIQITFLQEIRNCYFYFILNIHSCII